jgi:2Fe-2S ferredoxin
MPKDVKVTIYNPRGELEAQGEVPSGISLLGASVRLKAKHGSACGGVCACSTCHVWVKKGLESLSDMGDCEEDQLDKAYDVKPYSRLGCQAELDGEEVVFQITEESEKTWYDEHPKERHEAEAAGKWPPK